jgi:hypothetical protein
MENDMKLNCKLAKFLKDLWGCDDPEYIDYEEYDKIAEAIKYYLVDIPEPEMLDVQPE